MRKKISGIFFFLCICVVCNKANDSLIHHLMQRLDYLQLHHDPYFPQGLFPTYRQYSSKNNALKNDNNIFFTAIAGAALKKLKPYLEGPDQIICDSIIERIKKIAAKYKNTKGRNTYNFWPTDTIKIFPNSFLFMRFLPNDEGIADDLDDTVALLEVLNAPDSVISSVHEIMQDFSNQKSISSKTALKGYENFDSYSAWFGKKMIVEMDACILSNVLTMVQSHDLAWRKADSASVEYLVKMVKQKDYMKHPDVLAVYYKTTPIILYHLSRLMQIKRIDSLEEYKKQLIDDATQVYERSDNLMDKIILRTALLRWGISLPDEMLIAENIVTAAEKNDFNFFILNLACTLPGYLAFPLFNSGLTRYYYYCPAYNDVLLLEYLILQKRFDKMK